LKSCNDVVRIGLVYFGRYPRRRAGIFLPLLNGAGKSEVTYSVEMTLAETLAIPVNREKSTLTLGLFL